MTFNVHDTIVAVATPEGGAARGILRLSGPNTLACLESLFTPHTETSCQSVRRAQCIPGNVKLSDEGGDFTQPVDLLLWPDERSYTRQPVAELHTLGSPPLLDTLLWAICRAGARLAEPGEFTLRAFLAGRIDLPQAEAVIGVVDAQSSKQYETALNQLAGGISQPLHQLRENLLQLVAELEAGLDFVEEDISFISPGELAERFQQAIHTVDELREQMKSRVETAPSTTVVLWGPPNVGKSSLFNALAERYASNADVTSALVSHESGTTRDFLSAKLELGDITCQLIDTAGASDELPPATLEQISVAAQQHTLDQAGRATIQLVCSDSPTSTHPQRNEFQNAIRVLTKCDDATSEDSDAFPSNLMQTSSHTGFGLEKLVAALREKLLTLAAPTDGNFVAATAVRCHESLRLADEALQSALKLTKEKAGDELIAAETRAALDELGQVVGAVYTDDILDRVFSTFCIGK